MLEPFAVIPGVFITNDHFGYLAQQLFSPIEHHVTFQLHFVVKTAEDKLIMTRMLLLYFQERIFFIFFSPIQILAPMLTGIKVWDIPDVAIIVE